MVVRVGLKGKWHVVGILCIHILSSQYIGGRLVKFGQSRKYADFDFSFKYKILGLKYELFNLDSTVIAVLTL
jgi:hypothetical protein